MYLYINTTERDYISIAILDDDKVIKKKKVKSVRKHSEKLLKSIEQVLSSSKKTMQDIKGIIVVKGPGSFTSLRIGITTSNALAFGLGVPIVGIDNDVDYTATPSKLFAKKSKNSSIILPEYGSEPHITKSKK
jgi:tRNA threonylcarbamoyladenosine biosynthesis protein TsaB